MLRLVLACLCSLALSACATRGALDAGCPGFREHIVKLEPSPLVADILADAAPGAELAAAEEATAPADPLRASMMAGARATGAELLPGAAQPRHGALLLSGGGQWGAFGVGFLDALRKERPQLYPHPQTITGISTGGLQALYLAIGSEDALANLRKHYSPADEDEIVDRNALPLTALTGSIAGLKPLHRKLLNALCTGGDPRNGCPMIDALARDEAADAFIGFVDAVDGQFYYAPIKTLAKLPDRRQAQQCIAGAALASAAMPVFFQQVKVGGRVYYDGGVRQSVFEAEVGRLAAQAAQASGLGGAGTAAAYPALHVIRNGPTVVEKLAEEPDGSSDQPGGDALSGALRAEALVVNQLEVQSIADLRLAHPLGPIWLITADGWGPHGCDKPKGPMFAPAFMQCLMRFGAARAARPQPWRTLSQLDLSRPSSGLRVSP